MIFMAILVTGGAGFIGSHTAVELLNSGKDIVIVDNFSNSKPKALEAIKKITGKDFKFYEINYLDREKLEKVFEENDIEAVLNFAGYKSVGESVRKPLEYYDNNISGCLVLLETMQKYGVKKFVFVAQPDNTLKNTEIQVFSLNDGKYFYVTDGLKAGDKIVIEGVQNLKDGQSITPITPEEKEAEYQKALKDQKEGNIQTAFN